MISFCYFYCRIILHLFLYQWEVLVWLCILQYVILSAKSMINKHFALLSGIVCRRIWYIILPRVAAKVIFVCLWFFVCIFHYNPLLQTMLIEIHCFQFECSCILSTTYILQWVVFPGFLFLFKIFTLFLIHPWACSLSFLITEN